jgi:hypothetical protein
MKYIMLVYMDAKAFAALPKEEQTRIHRDCGTWHEELMASGQSVGATGLQPPFTATSLREKNGQVMIIDGPFAETKEVLGGFETLECRDIDEALTIAKRFPTLLAGCCSVELRPLVNNIGECEGWDDLAAK